MGYYNDISPPASFITIDTRGYGEITLVFATGAMSTIEVAWLVDGSGAHDSFFTIETIESWDPSGKKEWRKYEVQGAKLKVTISPIDTFVEFHISYNMTA